MSRIWTMALRRGEVNTEEMLIVNASAYVLCKLVHSICLLDHLVYFSSYPPPHTFLFFTNWRSYECLRMMPFWWKAMYQETMESGDSRADWGEPQSRMDASQ